MIDLQEVQRGRRSRRPVHTFQIRTKPYKIQPFLLAPVLPGETLTRALLQARVVTDPIKHPLIGWWLEYYLFYVRHRDLETPDDFVNMVLQPGYDLSGRFSADDVTTYHEGSALNWTKLCRNRVVEEYFREEGETYSTASALVDSEPIASIGGETGLNSAINDADYVSDDVSLAIGGDSAITGREIAETLHDWQMERAGDMADATYGEWLSAYGVRNVEPEGPGRPELLRYVKEWTYPTNTIDPSSGTPRSACSWAVTERADKRRFFREPGFIFGVTCTRPKIYLSKQTGSLTALMDFAEAWMPWVATVDPTGSSMRKVAATSGPLSANTDAYWIDVRDILMYGDQFINFALTATDAGLVALPTAGLQRRYVASTDIDALFVDAAGGKNLVRHDGVVTLNVNTSVYDRSPRSVP